MSKKVEEKIRAVTVPKACEIMGCSRQTFYRSYSKSLKKLETTKKRNLYKEQDVLDLRDKIRLESQEANYEIIG